MTKKRELWRGDMYIRYVYKKSPDPLEGRDLKAFRLSTYFLLLCSSASQAETSKTQSDHRKRGGLWSYSKTIRIEP